MKEKLFQKKVENFVCEKCSRKIQGNGYTNHCPYCLWSKHVDINPGDRRESCNGMMKPMGLEIVKGEYILFHKCNLCGLEKKNKTSPQDNLEEIVKLS